MNCWFDLECEALAATDSNGRSRQSRLEPVDYKGRRSVLRYNTFLNENNQACDEFLKVKKSRRLHHGDYPLASIVYFMFMVV
jgi:hypothetical protein